MKSKIMKIFDELIPVGELFLDGIDNYLTLYDDVNYFEKFIDQKDVPLIVNMICDLITTETKLIPHPRFKSVVNYQSSNYSFGIFDSRLNHKSMDWISIGYGLSGLEIKSRTMAKVYNEPTIHINGFGYDRSGGLALAKKGVQIECYNIPREVADIVLNDFTKLEGNRNEIILGLAHSEDLTECNSDGFNLNHQIDFIKKGEIPYPGVDENSVYTIEKNIGKALIFGYANGYEKDKSSISLDMRVEIPGERFQFPSERRQGFDITEITTSKN